MKVHVPLFDEHPAGLYDVVVMVRAVYLDRECSSMLGRLLWTGFSKRAYLYLHMYIVHVAKELKDGLSVFIYSAGQWLLVHLPAGLQGQVSAIGRPGCNVS